jgi:hypothetical protein
MAELGGNGVVTRPHVDHGADELHGGPHNLRAYTMAGEDDATVAEEATMIALVRV